MCKLLNKQGWAITHFENVRSPFLRSEKSGIRKSHFFCTFLHIRPFQKSNCAITLFKVQKSAILKFALFPLIHSFQKSVCAIALFWHCLKEQQKVWLHIHTFLKSDKKCDCTFAHFQRAKMCDVKMCDCPTLVRVFVFSGWLCHVWWESFFWGWICQHNENLCLLRVILPCVMRIFFFCLPWVTRCCVE